MLGNGKEPVECRILIENCLGRIDDTDGVVDGFQYIFIEIFFHNL